MSFDEKQRRNGSFIKRIPLWQDPDNCPECSSDQVYKINFGIDGWHGVCMDCDHSWVLPMAKDEQ